MRIKCLLARRRVTSIRPGTSTATSVLTTHRAATTLGAMEVRISPELEQKLARLAQQQGRDAESLVQEAVERLVGYDEWFVDEVKKGLAETDRGESLSDEEVTSRIEKIVMGRQNRS